MLAEVLIVSGYTSTLFLFLHLSLFLLQFSAQNVHLSCTFPANNSDVGRGVNQNMLVIFVQWFDSTLSTNFSYI